MEEYYQLTYKGAIKSNVCMDEIRAIVSQAQKLNTIHGITGALFVSKPFHDQTYVQQTIEGPIEAVKQLWRNIQNDTRVASIDSIDQHAVKTRSYTNWSMQLFDTTHLVRDSVYDVYLKQLEQSKTSMVWGIIIHNNVLTNLWVSNNCHFCTHISKKKFLLLRNGLEYMLEDKSKTI